MWINFYGLELAATRARTLNATLIRLDRNRNRDIAVGLTVSTKRIDALQTRFNRFQTERDVRIGFLTPGLRATLIRLKEYRDVL